MRWIVLALALVACGEGGGGRVGVDGEPIQEGGVRDRLPDEPPCVLPDATASLREAGIPPCGTQFCNPGQYCCPTVPVCCSPCDPSCCLSTDGGWMPVDAPTVDARID